MFPLYPSSFLLYDRNFVSFYLNGRFQNLENTIVIQQSPVFKIMIFIMDFKSTWNLKLSYDFFDLSGVHLLSEAKKVTASTGAQQRDLLGMINSIPWFKYQY